MSKYFIESLGIRDNERRLYVDHVTISEYVWAVYEGSCKHAVQMQLTSQTVASYVWTVYESLCKQCSTNADHVTKRGSVSMHGRSMKVHVSSGVQKQLTSQTAAS